MVNFISVSAPRNGEVCIARDFVRDFIFKEAKGTARLVIVMLPFLMKALLSSRGYTYRTVPPEIDAAIYNIERR